MKLKRFKGVKNPPNLAPRKDAIGPITVAKGNKWDDQITRDYTLDLRDPDAQVLLRKMGSRGGPMDLKKARRVLGIMREIPEYSDLEALAAEYLRRKEMPYRDQVSLFGGRNAVAGGGIVVDFLVNGAGGWIAWAMHGLHWHSRLFSGDANYIARLKALSATHFDMPISEYVECWEDDCWLHGDRLFDLASQGLEFTPGRRV